MMIRNPIKLPSNPIKMPSNPVKKMPSNPIKMPSNIIMIPVNALKERRKNKLMRHSEPSLMIEKNSDPVIMKQRNSDIGMKTNFNEEEDETMSPPLSPRELAVKKKSSPKSKPNKKKNKRSSRVGDDDETTKNTAATPMSPPLSPGVLAVKTKSSPKSKPDKKKNKRSSRVSDDDADDETPKNTTATATPPSKPKKKKGVQFAAPEDNEIHRCVPRRSLLDRKQLWFDSQDFEDMYYECERTAQKLERGKKMKDKKYSAIGLEAWTDEGQRARTNRKEDAWDAVFREQYVGYEEGRRVSLNVSSAYQEAAEDAKQRAVEAAMGIQSDVEQFLLKSHSLKRLIAMAESQDDSTLHLSVVEEDKEGGVDDDRTKRRGSM